MRDLSVLISGALLGLFGVLGAGLVGISHEGTADRIALNEREALLQQLRVLVPAGGVDNDMLSDITEVSAPEQLGAETTRVYRGRLQGEPVALILNPVVAQGYSGAINMILSVDPGGKVLGVRVLGHHETPGLGDKVELERSDWILGFDGKSLLNPAGADWKVKRDGGVFDQFTGATVTPRAIVKRLKASLEYLDDQALNLFEAPAMNTKEGDQP